MKLTEEQKKHRKARRLWVKALRSGEYKWGRGSLNPRADKFCCLGVACMVAEKNGVRVKRDYNGSLMGSSLYTYQRAISNWLGLRQGEGNFGDHRSLAQINDDSIRNPFKRIANLIEKEPEGLFVD